MPPAWRRRPAVRLPGHAVDADLRQGCFAWRQAHRVIGQFGRAGGRADVKQKTERKRTCHDRVHHAYVLGRPHLACQGGEGGWMVRRAAYPILAVQPASPPRQARLGRASRGTSRISCLACFTTSTSEAGSSKDWHISHELFSLLHHLDKRGGVKKHCASRISCSASLHHLDKRGGVEQTMRPRISCSACFTTSTSEAGSSKEYASRISCSAPSPPRQAARQLDKQGGVSLTFTAS